MLWLIVGVVLLVIAIAGGAIVHPVLFALGVIALLIFLMGARGPRTAPARPHRHGSARSGPGAVVHPPTTTVGWPRSLNQT